MLIHGEFLLSLCQPSDFQLQSDADKHRPCSHFVNPSPVGCLEGNITLFSSFEYCELEGDLKGSKL